MGSDSDNSLGVFYTLNEKVNDTIQRALIAFISITAIAVASHITQVVKTENLEARVSALEDVLDKKLKKIEENSGEILKRLPPKEGE